MSREVFEATFQNLPKLKESNVRLKKYGKVPISIYGEMNVIVPWKQNKPKQLSMIVVDEPGPTLLGRDWIHSLGMSVDEIIANQSSKPIQHISSSSVDIDNLFKEFPLLFDETSVGNLKDVKVSIDVSPDATPKYCNARSIPHALKDKVDEELDRLLKEVIIESVKYSK